MDNIMENRIKKWEETELLIECKDPDEKMELSNVLEELADNLLHNDDQTHECQIKAGILIPLSVRLFNMGCRNININRLINLVNELYPKLQSYAWDSPFDQDAEMEFICLCEEEYIKILGNNEKTI